MHTKEGAPQQGRPHVGGPTSVSPPTEQAPTPSRRGWPSRGTLSTAHSRGPTPWEAGSGVRWLGRSSPAMGRDDRLQASTMVHEEAEEGVGGGGVGEATRGESQGP